MGLIFGRFVGGVLTDWKDTKKEYERITGKSKPTKTLLGIRKSTGIESVLDAFNQTADSKTPPAKVKAAMGKYKSTMDTYVKFLESRTKELEKVTEEKEKKQAELEAKAINMLKKKLKSIYAEMGEALAEREEEFAKEKTGDVLANSARAAVVHAVKSGLAGMAQINADPTPATYNKAMIHADTMRVALDVKVENARDKGAVLPDPKGFIAKAKPFYDGDKRRIDKDADKNEVLKQSKEFIEVLKEIHAAYKKK